MNRIVWTFKLLYKSRSGKERHLTSISSQGWQAIAFMEVSQGGSWGGSKQTDIVSIWEVDHSETETFLESVYPLFLFAHLKSSFIQWNVEETQRIFAQWLIAFSSAQWRIYNLHNSDLFKVECGWPLAFFWDWSRKEIEDSQVNLASDCGWGRNVWMTSQVVFSVLGMNNSNSRGREGYKQAGLCVFPSREWCWRTTTASLFYFVYFWLWLFLVKGMRVLKSKLVSKDLCSGWDILCRIRRWFLLLLLSVSFFLLTLRIYMPPNVLKENRKRQSKIWISDT